jgi:hypothetical protein
VLERYRGTEHEAALTRLSRWAPEIPDEKLARELADTVERLLQRHGSARLLLDKMARGESLSEDERETLRRDSGRVGGKQNLD